MAYAFLTVALAGLSLPDTRWANVMASLAVGTALMAYWHAIRRRP